MRSRCLFTTSFPSVGQRGRAPSVRPLSACFQLFGDAPSQVVRRCKNKQQQHSHRATDVIHINIQRGSERSLLFYARRPSGRPRVTRPAAPSTNADRQTDNNNNDNGTIMYSRRYIGLMGPISSAQLVLMHLALTCCQVFRSTWSHLRPSQSLPPTKCISACKSRRHRPPISLWRPSIRPKVTPALTQY